MSDDLTKEVKATLAPITPIPDNEPYAKPSLWNTRYREIDAHFGFVYSPYNKPLPVDIGAADRSHTHQTAQITDLQSLLDGKAPTSHTHSISQITSLQSSLDGKLSLAGGSVTGKISFGRAAASATVNPFDYGFEVYSIEKNLASGLNLLNKSGASGVNLYSPNYQDRYFVFSKIVSSVAPASNDDFAVKAKISADSGEMFLVDGTKRVYHQGFKPSAADVGAYAKSETYTQAEVNSKLAGKSIGYANQLTNQNLNDIKTAGVYYQSVNNNTSTALNYPILSAGSLVVYVAAGIIQEYRVYNNSLRYSRAQYSNGDWTPWVMEYNQKYKPTPDELGALPLNNGTGHVLSSSISYGKYADNAARGFTYLSKSGAIVAGSGLQFKDTTLTNFYFGAGDNAWGEHSGTWMSIRAGGVVYVNGKQRVYHEGYKPSAATIGAYTQSECNSKFIAGVRLGTRTAFQIWGGAGFAEKAGYVVTSLINNNSDDLVDSGYARPLQYLLNGTWYTCSSV